MASTTLTADRRWASSRKSGMTVLGKVPKPINLPSQRLENNGLDPNVEIVPKGTIMWGSRPTSSSNAWSSTSSNISTKIEATASSPPDLMGRPGSSGSSTCLSSGNTDRQLGSDPPHAWGPNSRPSSASGSFASGHPLGSPNRPRSADTRPGSSHLSRFAESSGESKAFTLSSGDFPTLGSERPAEPRGGHSSHGRPTSGAGRDTRPKETLDTLPPGHSSHGRPTSGAGRDTRPKETLDTLPPGHNSHLRPTSGSGESNTTKAPIWGDFAKTTDGPQQGVNVLRTEDPSNTNWYSEPPYQCPPNPYHHPGPNQPNIALPVPPPQYDASSWRGPPPQPIQQTPEGAMWYQPGPHAPAPRGPSPYRPTGPPNNYPIDSIVYYPPPPHFRPPNSEPAPRVPMPPHSPYTMPAHPVGIPGRPHAPFASVPPVPYDGGFYGSSRPVFYGNSIHNHNNNGSTYHNSSNNQHVMNQGQNKFPGSSVMGSDVPPKQFKVLLKHKEEEKEDEKQPQPSVMTHGKDHSSELSEKPTVRKNTALIKKIEELNSKARNLEASNVEIKNDKPKPGEGILGTPSVNESGGMSIHLRTGEEVSGVRQNHAEKRLNETRRMRQRLVQVPNQVVPVKGDALLKNTTAISNKVLSVRKEGDDSVASDANLPPSDPAEYEIQRALLKEKAAQRAREIQREEEERTREQRVKALAKLEELNRRATSQKEPVDKESEPPQSISDSHFQQEPVQNISADTQLSPPINDSHVLQDPSDTISCDKHLPQPICDSHSQHKPSDIITANTSPEEVPLRNAEINSSATVTLSFGTMQIEIAPTTHISQVPVSPMKTSPGAAGDVAGSLVIGSSSNTGARAIGAAGTGTSSLALHHSGKQTGYKMMNISDMNPPTEQKAVDIKQSDVQVSVSESMQHKDDTTVHHRRRNNRNPKNRSKTEVPPVSVPIQSVAPLKDRPRKELDEKIESGSSNAPTSDNSNSVQPEHSGKEVSRPLEGELRTSGGTTRAGPHWKAQQQKRPVRNHRTISDNSHGNEAVMWAPVKHPKDEVSHSSGTTVTVASPKNDGEHAVGKTKIAEMERYVPKAQLSQLKKKPEESTDVKAGKNLLPLETKAGEADSRTIMSGTSANLNKSMRHGGKPHASWHRRLGPVEMHENMFPNHTDGEKTWESDTQFSMPTPSLKNHEDIHPYGRPRRHNGQKLYKATGSNNVGHGAFRSETENSGEIVDGASGSERKLENMEISNHGSNTKSQHWKPKSQTHVYYSHWKGDVGWQKVVSDKVGPPSGKEQDEYKSIITATEGSGSSASRRQHGNTRQYKSGISEEREINRERSVTGSYQSVSGEDRMEAGNRVAIGSKSRGRGRNGYYARRASDLSI